MTALRVFTTAAAGGAPSRRRQPAAAERLRSGLLVGACLWLAAAATTVPAAAATAATTRLSPGHTESAARPGAVAERRLPLFGEDALLRGGQAVFTVPLYLPPGHRGGAARLTLTYANALAVEPDDSVLLVSANGEPLAELPLTASQGAVSVELGLPAGVLRPGVNRLTFAARQHHRFACSREEFDELWTRLDRGRSFLDFGVADRTGPGSLTVADLDAVLASSLYDGEPFTVLTVRPAGDDAVPQWGALVAEGYALRRGDRPARIGHAALRAPGAGGAGEEWATLAGRNVAVVGTYRELEGILPPNPPQPAGEGVVAVLPLPADPDHVAVILSGPNEAAVTRAAEAFRTAVAPSVEAAIASAGGRRPALAARTAAAPVVEGGRWTSLAELGYATAGQVLSSVEELQVPVNLPETFYGGDGQKLRLALNFAYGAGLAPTSALVVNVNGAPWNMVRLDRRGGAVVDDERIELPLGVLRPGPNTIGLKAVLDPEGPATCAAAADRPMFSLFDDSRIHVPEFAHLARQPDLALFGATGYPYSSASADAAEMIVAEASPAALGAAWTLRGKLAQQRGRPLPAFRTGYRPGDPDRHLLVVGPRGALPPAVRDAVSATVAGRPNGGAATGATVTADAAPAVGEGAAAARRTAAEQARRDWAARIEDGGHDADDGPLGTVAGWFVSMARAVPGPQDAAERRAALHGLGALDTPDRPGTLVAVRSPFVDDRTVTVVTAASATALERAVGDLITPAVWRQLDGDAVGWGDPATAVVSLRTAEPYLIEPIDTSPGHLLLLGQSYLARQPVYWLLLVFGLIGTASLTTRALLRRMTAA